MVRPNNMIPNGHFHKKWQRRIKTWFDQPMKKIRRRTHRTKKLTHLAPRPMELLRPMVHSPSVRYHAKLRAGRGFTLQELKQVGLNEHYARTIGIAVDSRRKNRCLESLIKNVKRLKEYQQRLILFPVQGKKVMKLDSGSGLNSVKFPHGKVKIREVSEKEEKFEAYITLRKARSDAKYAGLKIRRKLKKGEICD